MALEPLIAVVDDDVSFREALVGMMGSLGYRAEGHASGPEVLGSERLGSVSLFLLDVQMPGMSGLELQRAIHERGVRAPVIFLTGARDRGVRARALAQGASGFLDKPFDDDELLACVTGALSPASGAKTAHPRLDCGAP